MDKINWDNPSIQNEWISERREEVIAYLKAQGVVHGPLERQPRWHLVPYVSLWGIHSLKQPLSVGWWAICGDGPTDYASSKGISHPREALDHFAKRWEEAAEYMGRGQSHPEFSIGKAEDRGHLSPLLLSRSKIFKKWAHDDSLWTDRP
jgi:hypothetical protein